MGGMMQTRPVAALSFSQKPQQTQTVRMRIDKWLWAARFFKTRSLAQAQIDNGRVRIDDQTVKPSRDVAVGDTVQIHTKDLRITLQVLALSEQRGPAPVAQALYAETEQSKQEREAAKEAGRAQWAAQGAAAERPTKRDRRERDAFEAAPDASAKRQAAPEWNARWSAQAPE